MSTARKTEPVPDLAERFREVKPTFEARYAAIKREEEALKKRSLACFVFENLMGSAEGGRLRPTERETAPKCAGCKKDVAVVFRNEDRAAMGIYEKIETVHYAVCFGCCVAHELGGSHTDGKGGRHWSLLRP